MSNSHHTNLSADRNLLFGILALQLDFISRDALIEAMNAWVLDKTKPLGQILAEQGHLSRQHLQVLELTVAAHLKAHNDEPHQSLAAVSSVEPALLQQLNEIGDADVRAGLSVCGSVASANEENAAQTPSRTDGPSTIDYKPPFGLRYRILRPHAKGGLGEVFVAKDSELNREVALKEIRADRAGEAHSRDRFLLEAEITAGLEHPGIVPVYGIGQYDDGRPYYAMRFIKGDNLNQAIKQFHKDPQDRKSAERTSQQTGLPAERNLALRQLLRRFVDVCNAVAYAHSRAILHRDIKPHNIMLGRFGETLVVDWGLGKPLGRQIASTDSDESILRPAAAEGDITFTHTGAAVGTLPYMSPEQAAGKLEKLGPASDIYSLGATLYHMLTGRPPFVGVDQGEMLNAIQRADFPRPRQIKRDIARPLEAICLKAMAPDPQDRYVTVQKLTDDIEHWLADEPVKAWPEPVTVKMVRWMRKHKPVVAGVAAALLVSIVAGGAGWVWYQREQLRHEARLHGIEKESLGFLALAQTKYDDLQADLVKPGGVFQLLNNPDRWRARIKAAQAALSQANLLVADNQGFADTNLSQKLQDLSQQLEADQDDFQLALQLEDIRLKGASIVKGDFDYSFSLQEYPKVFAQAQLPVDGVDENVLAERMRRSPIRDQLVAALDDWLLAALFMRQKDLRSKLLRVADMADRHPWRAKLGPPGKLNRQVLNELVKSIQKDLGDKDTASIHSPQKLRLLGVLAQHYGVSAENLLREAHFRRPSDFWVNLNLGYLLLSKKPAEAAGFSRAALAIRPDNGAALNNLGWALYEMGKSPRAASLLRKAIHLDSQNLNAHISLGLVLAHQRKAPEGAALIKKAIEHNPKSAIAYSNLAYILRMQEDWPGAERAARKAIKLNSQLAQGYVNLGDALRNLKDLGGAIKALRHSTQLDPANAANFNNLGALLAEKGDMKAASMSFKKAVKLDPSYFSGLLNLGRILLLEKDLKGSASMLRKAIATGACNNTTPAKDIALAWYYLGNTLKAKQEWHDAIAAYKKALEFDPLDVNSLIQIGSTYHDNLQQYQKAEANFRSALKIAPDNAFAVYCLGNALRSQKNMDAAIAAYKKAAQLDPKLAQAHYNLGVLRFNQGDFAAALKSLRLGHELGIKLPNWRHPSADAVKKCEQLLQRNERIAAILKGTEKSGDAAELIRAAHHCRYWKENYHAAFRLFALAFAVEPKLADDLPKSYRLHAAQSALAAAAGRGKDAGNLNANDRAELRNQALEWLQADLAQWTKHFENANLPMLIMGAEETLPVWQSDPNLDIIRDREKLAALPNQERQAFLRLWKDVSRLLWRAHAKYTGIQVKSSLTTKTPTRSFLMNMTAGRTYIIDLNTKDFKNLLYLDDVDGNHIYKRNKEDQGKLTTQLFFRPENTGNYRIICTSFEQRGRGTYEVTIREFAEMK